MTSRCLVWGLGWALLLLIFWGCPAPQRTRSGKTSTSLPGKGRGGKVRVRRLEHQVRLTVGRRSVVLEGVLLLARGRFYLVAQNGPVKVLEAVGRQGVRGARLGPGAPRQLVRGALVAVDVWRIFQASCPAKKGGPTKRVSLKKKSPSAGGDFVRRCVVEGEDLSEHYRQGRLWQKRFSGCLGERTITYSQHRPWAGQIQPSKIVLLSPSRYKLELFLTSFFPQAVVQAKLFRLSPSFARSRSCR